MQTVTAGSLGMFFLQLEWTWAKGDHCSSSTQSSGQFRMEDLSSNKRQELYTVAEILLAYFCPSQHLVVEKSFTAKAGSQVESTAKGSTVSLVVWGILHYVVDKDLNNSFQTNLIKPLAACSYCASPNAHTDKFFQHSKQHLGQRLQATSFPIPCHARDGVLPPSHFHICSLYCQMYKGRNISSGSGWFMYLVF